jgi:hypothetical protein
MSPARDRSYHPPRDRREVFVAVLASMGIVVVTIVMLFVLAPEEETLPEPIDFTPPTTLAPTTESSTPASSTPASSTPSTSTPASSSPGG